MSRKERRHQRLIERGASGGAAPVSPVYTASPAAALAQAGAALQAGHLSEAEGFLRRAVQADPNHAEAHNWLGVICHQKGDNREAARHFRRATGLRPESAEFAKNLGLSELATGDFEAARESLQRALALNDRLADVHYGLGMVHRNARNWEAAIACFERAVALAPDDANTQVALGNALTDGGRANDAIRHFEKLRTLFPDLRDVRYGLAAALDAAGRIEEAAAQLREIIGLIPGLLEAFTKLGGMSATLGRFDEAETYFKLALAIQPDCPDALYHLAHYTKALSNPQAAAQIENYLKAERPAEKKTLLHFALGKIYDTLGDYAHAFENYKSGNDLMKAMTDFDADFWTSFMDRLIETFTPELFAARSSFGCDSRRPIFIFGMPRSGTTLVEQIIASHPSVAAGGELDIIPEMTWGLAERLGLEASYPECVNGLDRRAVLELANSYLSHDRVKRAGAERVTDKMPGNFAHLGFLALLFPKATFIHCRRNAMDTCLSCYFAKFTTRLDFTYGLEDLGAYYRGYRRLMDYWREVLPVKMLEVDYEGLVADQEGVSRRLIAHCGLAWDDCCLAFHETKRPVQTASVSQVRQPLYARSVERWRRYEPFLGALRTALGEYSG